MVLATSIAVAVALAPATAGDEAFKVEGCDTTHVLFLGAMDDDVEGR